MKPAIIEFTTYKASVAEAFDSILANHAIREQKRILLKPNLVTADPFPVTTSPRCCESIIDYIRACNPKAEIVIAEGTGNPAYKGMQIFDALGFTQLAAEKNVTLIDLNAEPTVRLENRQCKRFPQFYLPEIALSHFIISVPVLKAHTLSGFTGTMKNMMGFAPPSHYSGTGWNKAAFHSDLQSAIFDLNCYRSPDLTLMDASVAMPDSHLGGRKCNPPVGKLVAGYEPVETDRVSAGLLGMDWKKIGHLKSNLPAHI
ncbi:MAG: DUF362 domain-containing protein [Desulfobacteraceae bacterium]|nr:DUF362 domain-containing protein [Desulfobacteraceae bacterium]